MTLSYIIKIQRWYKALPGCVNCGSKHLAFKTICVYCYHDKYSDDCIACKEGLIHKY